MKYNLSVLFNASSDEEALDISNLVKDLLKEKLEGEQLASAQIAVVKLEAPTEDVE